MPGVDSEPATDRDMNDAAGAVPDSNTRRRSEDVTRGAPAAGFVLIGVPVTLKCGRDPRDLQGAEDYFC
jgi:hypothetical protein